ncbi:MAG: DUF481 domain-containing protein [Rariglobus sp.]
MSVFFRLKTKWLAACGVFVALVSLHAADEVPPVPDVLVYHDGDRVQGRLVRREGDTLIFKSLRFGELRVPTDDALVISAVQLVDVDDNDRKPGGKPTTPAVQSVASSPYQLTRMFKDFFGPWSGRITFSSQIISDSSDRSDVMGEVLLERKWTADEVSVSARYDYSQTNDIDTTDTFRGNGLWRHSLPKRMFTVYRPSYEWNRASTIDGIKSDYILLQQEIGVGVKAVDRDAWKIRVGVAENFFNNWDMTTDTHRSARIESIFLEADLKLPWRITLTERAVYFYSFADGHEGWEHRFEVTKKLTDTLSLGLRQELRYNDPDIRTEDYSLLRFLIGLDF